MPRKRLTFTVEEATYRAIVERLDADELVDDWVRAAIDERLGPSRDAGGDHEDEGNDGGDDPDDRQLLEFVDDCAI